MGHTPEQPAPDSVTSPAPNHVSRKTPDQIRAAKRGALVQALVGAVVGAIAIPVMLFLVIWGAVDEIFWLLILAPVVPILLFWGLDALMNETPWSLLRGLVAGVCVILGIPLVFIGFGGNNGLNLIYIGACGGLVGVLLSRVRELVRRPSAGR